MMKTIIQGVNIPVVILHLGENNAHMSGGFCQCLSLGEWVKSRPDHFVVQKGETKTTYRGVQWDGDVVHSCQEEMTLCIGGVKFSYDEIEQYL